MGIEKIYLNIIKEIYGKPTANITLSGQTLKAFLKIRKKTGMSTLTMLFQLSTGSSRHNHQTIRRNKRYPNWKGKGKIVIFCRRHDTASRKTKRFHQIITRSDK